MITKLVEWRIRKDGRLTSVSYPNRDVARSAAKATGGVPVKVVISEVTKA